MGVQDRDWYREHHREQRRKAAASPLDTSYRTAADEWRDAGKAWWRSAVHAFAFYGAGTALIKLFRWLF